MMCGQLGQVSEGLGQPPAGGQEQEGGQERYCHPDRHESPDDKDPAAPTAGEFAQPFGTPEHEQQAESGLFDGQRRADRQAVQE